VTALGEPAPARTRRGRLARALLRRLGWRVRGRVPDDPRWVAIAAPHTSNWDFPVMLLVATALELRPHFLMKASWFRGPLGPLFRALGGIPVRRDAQRGLVADAARRLRERERMILAVPPEGSRGWRPHWRSGFYWIAHEAGVPIVLGFVDFGTRTAGLGPAFHPTGDLAADMRGISAFYAGMKGRRPAQQGPVRVADEG
jgi:1-acyl-sn-glycerol-3-phosphate acyltransferase